MTLKVAATQNTTPYIRIYIRDYIEPYCLRCWKAQELLRDLGSVFAIVY